MLRTNLLLLLTIIGQFPVLAEGQVEIIRGIDRVIQAGEARERRQSASEEAAENQRKLETDTRLQLEASKQHPGAMPRERYSNEAALSNNPWARERQRAREIRVELFVADACENCERMERYLNDVGVPYSRHFLEPGSEAEQMYLAQIGRGTIPVVRVNGKVIRGFEPETVRAAILEEKSHLRIEDLDTDND